uniref:Dynein heavy chain C-terminal domain-containing protein n=1 Tax=Sinocyclocheilus rhinocerous TaxID=307959 RepID=A0A673IRK3_9TELE
MFAFLLCSRILTNDSKIDMVMAILVIGGRPQDQAPNPAPNWLSMRTWQDMLSLSTLSTFSNLPENFSKHESAFKSILYSSHTCREPLPGEWDSDLDSFQKLLVLRCLRADWLTHGLQDFVASQLGQNFIEPQNTVNVRNIRKCKKNVREVMKFSKKMSTISLGQGQGPSAEAMMHSAMEKGQWVFFQNCHLVHRDFRLWLTSLPSNKFPVSILQNGSKMTIEPPRGIKANLLRTYASLTDDFIISCTKVPVEKNLRLSSCLCVFSMEFTDGDLHICISQLKMFLDEYQNIPYKVLKYTAGEINYGGCVTDNWDRRCILNYCPAVLGLEHIYSPSGEYRQINTENNGYLTYFRGLPIKDWPEIFGLHVNANISFAQNEIFALLGTLVKLQPRAAASGGKSRDEVCVILILSVFEYNKLLSVISRSLSDLVKPLKGLVVMSSELELMSNSLFINAVPELWKAKAYPSLKPLASWVSDLVQRISFLQNWISDGIPAVFWISGCFFPQAFLTGTLQNFARSSSVSIDINAFDFKVMKEVVAELTERPDIGCFIHGLYLEGARWDAETGQLAESRPKELYTEMAVIWMVPVPNRKPPQSGIYVCPIYKTLTRAGTLSTTGHSTNYVTAVELPTDRTQGHWIKQGMALICALDY